MRRRHAAAMTLIHDASPDERVLLLYYVVCGSDELDRATTEADEMGLDLPHARGRKEGVHA